MFRLPFSEKPVTEISGKEIPGQMIRLAAETPMMLDNGGELRDFPIAYQTYGTLNADKSNAILICHALTGDQFVAEKNPITGREGWWSMMVGPGKPVDTDRFFVICFNVLGGCMGSFGPRHPNPATHQAFGLDFPVITVGDMVRAQILLVDALGIDKLFCVIGPSGGGMQALEWAKSWPHRLKAVIPIATAAKHSSQNMAFHEVARQAIMADPDWHGGQYQKHKTSPKAGLAVARMATHITYLSESALHRKFGRSLQNRDNFTFSFDADFQIESYLRHQGSSFVERFDANSYLYITRAMNYFDLGGEAGLVKVFADNPVRFCVISFTSDWLFPTRESLDLVHALSANAVDVSFAEIESDKGHDAFLLDEPVFHQVVRGFLDSCAETIPTHAKPCAQPLRKDLALIADLIAPNSRVLDIGCGEGALLCHLTQQAACQGRGIEIDLDLVRRALAAGLPVMQGNADTDLSWYPDHTFDYVILSQTLQAMQRPKIALEQMLRIGKKVIVSFHNFAYWRVRMALAIGGKMPVTKSLPYSWYDTPNIHFFTLDDFIELCRELGAQIETGRLIDGSGNVTPYHPTHGIRTTIASMRAEQAVFMVSMAGTAGFMN